MKIIFATKNQGKLKEINAIMGSGHYQVVSMTDAGIDLDVVEDGQTFEENALKKAIAIMEASGQITLADDSGLEIDYLNKQPGVLSARYMGEDTPYDIKNAKILSLLADVPDERRTARFVSVIAAAFPDGRRFISTGVIEGLIAHEIRGANGFGYDPIFLVPKFQMTTAEMAPEDKNKISHRGKALRLMKEKLDKL